MHYINTLVFYLVRKLGTNSLIGWAVFLILIPMSFEFAGTKSAYGFNITYTINPRGHSALER
jgi:hypothetical protein